MAKSTYDKKLVVLLVIDPYNDLFFESQRAHDGETKLDALQ